MDIIKKLAQELAIKEEQAKAAVQLIDEGNTIPFIARYRKEMTGALNDETLRNLHERLLYLRNLEEKKEQVINAITEQDKMTDELKKKILAAETLVAVDDLYRPYRPKKQTRATKAKEKGLEPLANLILLQMTKEPLEKEAEAFINEEKDVKTIEDALKGAAWAHQDKVSFQCKYDFVLSNRIYAGCDMFLMPSLFEPCGLSQMMSLKYGTIPIVRETGGLADSVQPYNEFEQTGTGFSFYNYNAHEMMDTIDYALHTFYDYPDAWDAMVQRAMAEKLDWDASAEQYIRLFASLL